MNYKEMFNELNILSINDCYNYLYNIMFGWKDKQGNIHKGVNDRYFYSLQTPYELSQSKYGICWDVVEFARCFFEEMTNFKHDTFYLFYDDNNNCPSHSFLVFYDKEKLFLFEPTAHHCFYPFSGIVEFDKLDDLLKFVIYGFLKNCIGNDTISKDFDENNILVYKYYSPKFHINGVEMRNHINNSEKIEVIYDRKSI